MKLFYFTCSVLIVIYLSYSLSSYPILVGLMGFGSGIAYMKEKIGN